MSTVTFDTLKFADRLEKAGMSREQAAAIAEAQKDAFGEVDVATKRDVEDLRREIRESELRMTIKLGAMQVVAVGILIAAMRVFAP